MKGETKRYGSDGNKVIAKREIAGNTYIVAVVHRKDGTNVAVYADKKYGKDKGFPDSAGDYSIKIRYDYIHGDKLTDSDTDLTQFIAKVVNKAVRKFEGRMEGVKSTEDSVLGALEANAEVHEGDDE